MANSEIRTTYGNSGRRPIRHVHFEQQKNADGTFTVSGMNGKITGTGASMDIALQNAQTNQQEVFAKDQQSNGDGFRRVTSVDQLADRMKY